MGILIGPVNNRNVESRVVAEEPLTEELPEGHGLASRRPITLQQIAGEAIVLERAAEWAAFREIVFDLYGRVGLVPRIAHEASSAPALMGLVGSGMGISLYAGSPKLYQGDGVVFRPLKPARRVPISVAWRRDANLPLVRQVLRMAGWAE